jgi:glycosyltransferase involved in cell wall biosynthesis
MSPTLGRPAVLIVTSEVPFDRVAPFRALHERMPIVVARFGGERRHAGQGVEDPGVPTIDISEREVARTIRRGRWKAVVAGTVGRVALPSAYAAARTQRLPFVLWSALWSQPHALSAPLMLHLYRRADAIAAYGEHVAAYAKARGARTVVIAPQAVDPAFWSQRTADPRPGFHALYVGRTDPEKGVHVLLEAWRRAGLEPPAATLTLVGGDVSKPLPPGVAITGRHGPEEVRNFLGTASVVVVPSIATRAFREPWGLVVNEAMHQQLPVIATDAVGAAAGGLVRHERNGLVVPQGDAAALADALRRLESDAPLRDELGANASRDVAAFTPEAWAAGMASAVEATTR